MIETKPILQWPEPLLSKKLERVGAITEEVKRIAAELTKTCLTSGAIGLTANQIGYDKAIFVMLNEDGIDVVIDPQIIEYRGPKEFKKEGCMSMNKVYARIGRPIDIDVVFSKLDGTFEKKTLKGMAARVFQHEFDHTEGKMIFDHLPNIIKKFTLEKFYKRK